MRATAPVARSAFWLAISLMAWELYQGLRAGSVPAEDAWAIAPVDLAFLTLLPALSAFAFTRLFLVMTQSARGSLNVYTVISSPYAWLLWLGLFVGMIGHGIHMATHAIRMSLPDIFVRGEFASQVIFLDLRVGYVLLGAGFFLATLVILLIGQDAGPRIAGLERMFFVLSSLATYGVVFIYLGVGGQQIVPAIAASLVLSAVGFWRSPPSEITDYAIGALVIPGTFLSCVALIVWALVAGGQPVWP
jgi:hypothetical protein